MADITLSKAVRSNLLNLQSTAALMGKTQDRLSTGKKVNSALDNPINFFTASSLDARASDMSSLLDSMGNGIQTIDAANNGLTAITNTLQSMQSTLTQARQDKSFKASSYSLDNTTIGHASAKTISFSGGAVGTTGVNVALNTVDTAAVQSTVVGSAAYVAPTAATSASYTGGTYSGSAFVGGTDSMTIDGTTITFDGTTDGSTTIAAGATGAYTITEAVAKINNDLTAASSTISAAEGTGADAGKIVLTNSATGASSNFAVVQSTTNTGGLTSTTTTSGVDAVDRAITINDGNGNSLNLTLTSSNAGTAATAVTYINAQIAADTNLAGTITASQSTNVLTLTGKADGSNSITVSGTNATDVFGSSATTTAGAVATTGSVKTVDQLVDAINTNTSLDTAIRASNDNGKLRIENLSTQDLTVTGYNSTSSSIDGSTGTATIGGNTVRADLASQYNTLRDQLDKISDDASFNGINLLRGDNLQITFNETSTSQISIQAKNGKAVNSANLGIQTSLSASQLDSDTSIDGFITQVKTALGDVRSQASAFGSNLSVVQNRQDFTKNMINTLQTGASNLTLADTNEEAANLLALQTRQQLSTKALSLASQADQNVLRLF